MKIEDFIQELSENILVDGVDVDYPAGMDAGHSVTLTLDGEKQVEALLESFIESYNGEL